MVSGSQCWKSCDFFQNVVHFWLAKNQSISKPISEVFHGIFPNEISSAVTSTKGSDNTDLERWASETRRDETVVGAACFESIFPGKPVVFFGVSKKRPCAWKWFVSRLFWRLGTRVWKLMESYKCFAASSIFIYVWWSSKSISSIWHLLPLVFGQGPTVSSNHCLTKKLFRTA